MNRILPFAPIVVIALVIWWSETWNVPEPETWQERQDRIERRERLDRFAQRGFQLEIEFMKRTRDEQIEFLTLQYMGEGIREREARLEAIAEFNDDLYFLYIMSDQGDLIPDEPGESPP